MASSPQRLRQLRHHQARRHRRRTARGCGRVDPRGGGRPRCIGSYSQRPDQRCRGCQRRSRGRLVLDDLRARPEAKVWDGRRWRKARTPRRHRRRPVGSASSSAVQRWPQASALTNTAMTVVDAQGRRCAPAVWRPSSMRRGWSSRASNHSLRRVGVLGAIDGERGGQRRPSSAAPWTDKLSHRRRQRQHHRWRWRRQSSAPVDGDDVDRRPRARWPTAVDSRVEPALDDDLRRRPGQTLSTLQTNVCWTEVPAARPARSVRVPEPVAHHARACGQERAALRRQLRWPASSRRRSSWPKKVSQARARRSPSARPHRLGGDDLV